jgi:hypothetical protein
MRRLNEEKARLCPEESNGAIKKVTRRCVIGVENDNEFAARMSKPTVQIPSFSMLVASSSQVLHTELLA